MWSGFFSMHMHGRVMGMGLTACMVGGGGGNVKRRRTENRLRAVRVIHTQCWSMVLCKWFYNIALVGATFSFRCLNVFLCLCPPDKVLVNFTVRGTGEKRYRIRNNKNVADIKNPYDANHSEFRLRWVGNVIGRNEDKCGQQQNGNTPETTTSSERNQKQKQKKRPVTTQVLYKTKQTWSETKQTWLLPTPHWLFA